MYKKQFIGEFFASFILALMGLGMIVPLAVDKSITLYQFCVLFGLLIAFVIILFNTISGAQFNPGVTISMIATKRQDAKSLLAYLAAQFAGWFAGTLCIYIIFWNQLKEFTESGAGNAVNLFFCSMPNIWTGILVEFIWTAFLLILVLGCIDNRVVNQPGDKLFPLIIGGYIIVAVAFGATYTGMALNAARDFSPRVAGFIFGLINGYDVSACFSDGQFVIYLLAPTAGAVAGTLFYDHVISKVLPDKKGE